MPPNQKHTPAFTYEPRRIAQECTTGGRTAEIESALWLLPFLSTSHVTALLAGGQISGRVKVIKAEDEERNSLSSFDATNKRTACE